MSISLDGRSDSILLSARSSVLVEIPGCENGESRLQRKGLESLEDFGVRVEFESSGSGGEVRVVVLGVRGDGFVGELGFEVCDE